MLVGLQGVDAQTLTALRRAVNTLGGTVVAVRNRSARALVRGTSWASMERRFVGPTALVLADRSLGALRAAVSGLEVRGAWLAGVEVGLHALVAERPPPPPLPPVVQDGVLVVPAAQLRATSEALRGWMRGPELPRSDGGVPPLRLDAAGPNRLEVVRLVWRAVGGSISDARDLVDRAPIALPVAEPALADALRAVGATVTAHRATRFADVVDVDPALFGVLRHLRRREGHALRARVFASSGGSHADLWAEGPDGVRLPVGAALVGDGAPESWLEASLLLRELGDFAAQWHGISWRAHELVDRPGPGEWTWGSEERLDLRPRVWRRDDGSVEVTLCTSCGLGGERLTAFVDRYEPPSMEPTTHEVPLARGGGGYVF